MIPKSGYRFLDKIMRKTKSMIPKSGHRFSDQIMRKTKSMILNQIMRHTKDA
jgi:hypothetical protein